jgi:hypothetical protein
LNEINVCLTKTWTKKNADQPRFFHHAGRKSPRLASLTDCGGSSRCHNRDAFLALTDGEFVAVATANSDKSDGNRMVPIIPENLCGMASAQDIVLRVC